MKLGAVAPRQSGCRARPGMHDPVRCAPAVPPEGAGRRTSPVDPGASLPSRAGQFLADHPCRVQAPGGVRRRHPDVDDRQLRTDRTDQGEQFCTVPCLADHVRTGTVEQAGETFAQQDVVVGQYHRDAHWLSGVVSGVCDDVGIRRLSLARATNLRLAPPHSDHHEASRSHSPDRLAGGGSRRPGTVSGTEHLRCGNVDLISPDLTPYQRLCPSPSRLAPPASGTGVCAGTSIGGSGTTSAGGP